MAERGGMPLLAVGALLGLLVAVDYLPSVRSFSKDEAPMKINAQVMGPALKFMYCYS